MKRKELFYKSRFKRKTGKSIRRNIRGRGRGGEGGGKEEKKKVEGKALLFSRESCKSFLIFTIAEPMTLWQSVSQTLLR